MNWFWLIAGGAAAFVAWLLVTSRSHSVADWGSGGLNLLDGLNRRFCRRYHGLDAGLLPIPARGGVILAANHISGLDPVAIIAAAPRPVRFLIAAEQYDRWWLRWLFSRLGLLRVDRDARPDHALRRALKALREGEVVALFPQGGIQEPGSAPVRLKRGVTWLARRSGAPIVPLRVAGVSGQGHTLLAVLMPSKVEVLAGPMLHCDGDNEDDCLERLGCFIDPRLQQARSVPAGTDSPQR